MLFLTPSLIVDIATPTNIVPAAATTGAQYVITTELNAIVPTVDAIVIAEAITTSRGFVPYCSISQHSWDAVEANDAKP